MDAAASPRGRRGLSGFYVVLVLFLYAPIAVLMIFSFNDSRLVTFPLAGFTTRWYELLLENEELIEALKVSAIVAAISSVCAVGLGIVASYAMVRRRFRGKAATSSLLLSPLVIPYVVFGIALLILFRAVDDFLIPRFGIYFGLGIHAIVIGHVVVSLPYTILTIAPRLERLSTNVEEAARDLGASPSSTFLRVTIPLLVPAIVSAYLIAFTLSFDEYAIASFIAGDVTTYPLFLYGQVRIRIGLPQMIAVSVIVLLLSMLLVAGTEMWRRR
ncbi:MAG TPA: ABC transporter permease, partial [Actinomycetota bacterium]|nr:ABC transporter permease [Actinomycetota bacterium]